MADSPRRLKVTRRLLKTYAAGTKLFEVGRGVGDDADGIGKLGSDYFGLDISDAAVRDAKARYTSKSLHFARADFFRW